MMPLALNKNSPRDAVVELGEQLALMWFWWIWDDPIIRKAMDAAHLEHWVEIVERDFAQNVREGRKPCDWEELSLMRRERQNVQRVAKGQSNSTKQFLLGIASILNRDVQTLFPPTDLWIAKTTLAVCSAKRRKHYEERRFNPLEAYRQAIKDGGGITLDEAKTYADFMLKHPPEDKENVTTGTERRLCGVAKDVRTIVVRVAEELGPLLAQVDQKLVERGARLQDEHSHEPRPDLLRARRTPDRNGTDD